MVLTAVVVVFLRVLIMWAYNGSGTSVIVVGLFHSAFNMTIGNEGPRVRLSFLAAASIWDGGRWFK